MLETKVLREELGEFLKERRGREKQYQLAERAGLDSSTLSDYETGKVVPTDDNLAKLAAAYGMTREQFFGALFQRLAAFFGVGEKAGAEVDQVRHALVEYVESMCQRQQDILRDSETLLTKLRE